MKVVCDIAKMRELGFQTRAAGLRLALVPTMGALHEGHLELVRRARAQAGVVVVSIFVNPTQFNDPRDLAAYPSDLERDRTLLAAEGVDILFTPAAGDVYPDGFVTTVTVSGLAGHLCGPRRPGHFEGVATVVTALLNMVGPDLAVFGEKDFQQLQIVRRLVRDLHLPVRILAAPTVREPDGLALSSRNQRLSPDERKVAPALYAALRAGAEAYLAGATEAEAIKETARRRLAEAPAFDLEYLDLVDGSTLAPVSRGDRGCVLAAAARLGPVRLIDNIVFARLHAEEPARALAGGVSHHA